MKKTIAALFALFVGTSEGCSKPPRAEVLELPVQGEWQVFWGGEQPDQNNHFDIPAQRYALDLCISTDQQGHDSYRQDGERNEDYYCWAMPVFSPFAGKVVISVDGIPDNLPGTMNEQMVYGNTVMIQGKDGSVAVLAHLKNGSVQVKVGDALKKGQKIAECGNSGNSSEPHLHFHMQTEVGFEKGAGLLPVFSRLVVNGETKDNYSPVKNEKIEREHAGTGQPATRPESKSEGSDKPQLESEGRSR